MFGRISRKNQIDATPLIELRTANEAYPIAGVSVRVIDDHGSHDLGESDEAGQIRLPADRLPCRISLSADGYCSCHVDLQKTDTSGPVRIRMMTRSPVIATPNPSSAPGQTLTVFYHAPEGAKLTLHSALNPEEVTKFADLPAAEAVAEHELARDGVGPAGSAWPARQIKLPAASSGLYVLRATAPGGSSSDVPVILRSKTPKARILALCSVATWACYNDWGGRNRYRDYEKAPASQFKLNADTNRLPWYRQLLFTLVTQHIEESVKERLKSRLNPGRSTVEKPLALDRPWSDALGLAVPAKQQCKNHLAALEVKILDWLEQEGLEVDLIADIDLANPEIAPEVYDAVILLGHSEYWNQQMFSKLSKAHQQHGTWVLNLSGNSIYREIGPVSVDARCIQVIAPVFALSGTDETLLTGARYVDRAYGIAQPYRAKQPDHWVFDGLDLADDGIFGASCLIRNGAISTRHYTPDFPTTPDGELVGQGACGWEVDNCSKTSRELFTIVAQGRNGKGGDMVVKDPSGTAGGVFGASSINFGGSLAVDQVVAGIVRNVLQRAGQS